MVWRNRERSPRCTHTLPLGRFLCIPTHRICLQGKLMGRNNSFGLANSLVNPLFAHLANIARITMGGMKDEFLALQLVSDRNLVEFLKTELALCSTLIDLGM